MYVDERTEQVLIYGAGGFGRELAWALQATDRGYGPAEVVAFVDDDTRIHGESRNGIDVVSLDHARERWPAAQMLVSAGAPKVREALAEKALAAGFEFLTFSAWSAEQGPDVQLGEGSVVCARSVLTTNILIGRHAQINLACTIGHDVVAGAFLTLAPGVHVSGWVHFGERVYAGTGAVFINGTKDQPLRIADDVVVGAGAVVTKSIHDSGITVVGTPAKPLARRM
jgi:sugar O-acyltransferase (sialic acid O-acetyltransferase NeuD family)